jgi:hypothetical protein
MMAKCLQLAPQFQEVVYLTVERDPIPLSIFAPIWHGISSRIAEIEDSQSAVTETQPAVNEYAAAIGATMCKRVSEPVKLLDIHLLP